MMTELSRKDQERLLISIIIAAIFHVALFTVLHFLLNTRLEAQAYTGPMYLEFGPEFEQVADTGKIIEDEDEKQEKVTVSGEKQDSSPSIVKRDDNSNKNKDQGKREPEINPVNDTEGDSLPHGDDTGKTENSSTGKEDAGPDIDTDNSLQSTQVPGVTPAPTSYNPAIEENSLAELDKLLEGDSTGKKDSDKDIVKTGKDDSSRTEDSGPIIQWEDNKDRNPVATYEPVIPDWVSRQGLRLRVKVSFLLTPDGILTSLRVKESSGYPDVDSRILDALRKWRFPPVSGTKNVYGEITYFIGLK